MPFTSRLLKRANHTLVNLKEDAHKMGLFDFLNKHIAELLPFRTQEPAKEIHEYIPPQDLDPSEWDDWSEDSYFMKDTKEKVDSMVKTLRLGGTLPPVLVEGLKDDPKFRPQVLDGHHRTMAYFLSKQKVPVVYHIDTLIELWLKENGESHNPVDIRKFRKAFESSVTQ
jgi:acetyl esterase/lipase